MKISYSSSQINSFVSKIEHHLERYDLCIRADTRSSRSTQNFVMSLKTEVAARGGGQRRKKDKEEVENSHERTSLGYRKSLSTYSIQMKLVFFLCATSFASPYRYFFLCSYNVSGGFCSTRNSTVNESIRDLSGIPSWPIKFAIKLKPFVFIKKERAELYLGHY